MSRVHIIISGDVQGVGFRAWVLREAKNLVLSGWVRNREDGTVELVAEGPKETLEKFIQLCHKGPEVAWVERVEASWSNATGEYVIFRVVY